MPLISSPAPEYVSLSPDSSVKVQVACPGHDSPPEWSHVTEKQMRNASGEIEEEKKMAPLSIPYYYDPLVRQRVARVKSILEEAQYLCL
jgi:hypothetical protein